MKPRPVMVIWNDACLTTDGSKLGPERTVTIGFLVTNNRDGLTVATDWCEGFKQHGETRHFICWPMIQEWHYLEIE